MRFFYCPSPVCPADRMQNLPLILIKPDINYNTIYVTLPFRRKIGFYFYNDGIKYQFKWYQTSVFSYYMTSEALCLNLMMDNFNTLAFVIFEQIYMCLKADSSALHIQTALQSLVLELEAFLNKWSLSHLYFSFYPRRGVLNSWSGPKDMHILRNEATSRGDVSPRG